ncbi:acyltransferase family protein [gamma proteobacterium HTCC5015]|nr:acyltransferase family protein [gamma proteobacterium HTCC5015]
MLSFLPTPIVFALSYALFIVNLLFWCLLFYAVLLLKIIFWYTPLRKYIMRVLTGIAECWVYGNNAIMALMIDLDWDIELPESLNKHESYLVTANHQSWVDIVVLQKALTGLVPFPRFFLKKELIKVPVLGIAWWGLDFPFMQRYSREYLEKYPEKRGQDVEATRRACAHFKHSPVTVINFFEGTRFSQAKHDKQGSPYQRLLKPKAGGAAFTLNAMDGAIRKLVDITIAYPTGYKQFGDLFANRVRKVVVRARVIDVSEAFCLGDYQNDAAFRREFQSWVTQLWEEKDRQLAELLSEGG